MEILNKILIIILLITNFLGVKIWINQKKEIALLKEKIEHYKRLEVELSTTVDLLREGVIK